MRIQELLEAKRPPIKDVELDMQQITASNPLDLADRIGRGIEATAWIDDKDPHMVYKVEHWIDGDPLYSTGYHKYAQVCQNLWHNNTFLPRIDEVIRLHAEGVENGRNKTLYRNAYHMERLFDPRAESISRKSLLGMLMNLIDTDKWSKDWVRQHNGTAMSSAWKVVNLEDLSLLSKNEVWKHCVVAASALIEGKPSPIKDELIPKIKQAAKLLQLISGTYNGEINALDLHTGNYMVRLGGYIPQMVLTDPLVAR